MATAEASCILLDEELWRLASMMDKPRSRDGYYGKPLPITQAPTAPFAIFSALNSLGQRISPAGFRASSQVLVNFFHFQKKTLLEEVGPRGRKPSDVRMVEEERH